MKDSLYSKLYKGKDKKKSNKQIINEMILRNMCDHKRVGKHGNEKKNWEEIQRTVDGEVKTFARCLNPHCKKEICLDLVEPDEIKEYANFIINVFENIKINNKDSSAEFLELIATIITYLQLLPDMYKTMVLDRLDENGITPEDDFDMESTGPKFISSDKSWGFEEKHKKKDKGWKKKKNKKKDKDKKKKKKKNKYWD